MTREEFESILEEAYMEGYNTALEDIQEDILDEEAYDLEGDYDYYTESNAKTKNDHKNIINKHFEKDGGYNVKSKTLTNQPDLGHLDKYKYVTVKNGRVKDVESNQRGWINNQFKVKKLHDDIKTSTGEKRKNLIRSHRVFHDPDDTLYHKVF